MTNGNFSEPHGSSHVRERGDPTHQAHGHAIFGATHKYCGARGHIAIRPLPSTAGTLARMHGLRSRIPFPDFRGEGTWDELTQSRSEEMDFIAKILDDPMSLDFIDLSFLSDFGQSMAANAFYQSECVDPVRQLRPRLPASGEIVTSMTFVSLLCCSQAVAEATNEALLISGVLINPRLIHLVCDDSNLIQPWWMELQGWRGLVETWKDYEYVDIGRTDGLLTRQFQRSINWSNYSSPETVRLLQQDSELFTGLDRFLRTVWS